jgi:predicted metal-dependent phosphoesterase TrpH
MEPFEKQYANLHLHTTHSDGCYTPEEVVRIAKKEGYHAVSVTDHDTISGWDEFREACQGEGLDFLPGAEIYAGAFDVSSFHLVAYGFDPRNERVKALFQDCSERMAYKTKYRFDRAVAMGGIHGITWDEVVADNPTITWLYGDHVIRTLLKKGLLDPEQKKEFKSMYFSVLKVSAPALRPTPRVKDVVEIIKEAGGIIMMAHPSFQDKESYMEPMLELGIQGLELLHPINRPEILPTIAELIQKNRLYTGGGTDHFGLAAGHPPYVEGSSENGKRSIPSLQYGVSKEQYEQLLEGLGL